MANYIDSTYVGNAVGATVRDELTDSASTTLSQLIADASALVDSVLQNAGYTVPFTGTIPQLVKRATLGALLGPLFGRKKLGVPDQFLTEVRIFEGIRTGEFPIPGKTPADSHTVGGSKWSDATTATGNPKVMDKLRTSY